VRRPLKHVDSKNVEAPLSHSRPHIRVPFPPEIAAEFPSPKSTKPPHAPSVRQEEGGGARGTAPIPGGHHWACGRAHVSPGCQGGGRLGARGASGMRVALPWGFPGRVRSRQRAPARRAPAGRPPGAPGAWASGRRPLKVNFFIFDFPTPPTAQPYPACDGDSKSGVRSRLRVNGGALSMVCVSLSEPTHGPPLSQAYTH
jgi:hypothetical protein